jgi:uncharacterized protein YihD (DUF1040 family)
MERLGKTIKDQLKGEMSKEQEDKFKSKLAEMVNNFEVEAETKNYSEIIEALLTEMEIEILKVKKDKEKEKPIIPMIIKDLEGGFTTKSMDDLRNCLDKTLDNPQIVFQSAQQKKEFVAKLTEIVAKVKAETAKWEKMIKDLLEELKIKMEESKMNSIIPVLVQDIKTALKDRKKDRVQECIQKITESFMADKLSPECNDKFKQKLTEIVKKDEVEKVEENWTKLITNLLHGMNILLHQSENVKNYSKKFSRENLNEYNRGKNK